MQGPASGGLAPTCRTSLLLRGLHEASLRGDSEKVTGIKRELFQESPRHLSSAQVFADDVATARALADIARREKSMGDPKEQAAPVAGVRKCPKCGAEGFQSGPSFGAHKRHCDGVLKPIAPPRAKRKPSPLEADGKTPTEKTADAEGMALAIQALKNKASALRDRARALELMADELARQ